MTEQEQSVTVIEHVPLDDLAHTEQHPTIYTAGPPPEQHDQQDISLTSPTLVPLSPPEHDHPQESNGEHEHGHTDPAVVLSTPDTSAPIVDQPVLVPAPDTEPEEPVTAEPVTAESPDVAPDAQALPVEAEEPASPLAESAVPLMPVTEPVIENGVVNPIIEIVDEERDTTTNEVVGPRSIHDLEVGTELSGRVTSIALYGVFIDVGVGRDGLVHISEMSDTRIESPSDLVQIGDIVKVRVKGVDVGARRISLTMRTPRERPPAEERPRRQRREINREILSSLKVGDTIEGTITGLASFGAFVDIGVGKDGLVHISEMSEGRVERPEDAVQVGDSHSFKVLEVDPEGTRISLSLRRAQRMQKMYQLEPGQEIEGTVSGMAPFGAFIDIGVGRDGLVHISQLAEHRVGKVEDVVQIGDKVNVRVLEVDPQSKRISLTMRSPESLQAEADTNAETAAAAEVPTNMPNLSDPRYEHPEHRQDSRRDSQRRKGNRSRSRENLSQSVGEAYATASDPDEEFEGNATLEDLVTKFGGRRRDRRRPTQEEDEDERRSQRHRQRDIVRRTLNDTEEDNS